MKWYSGEQQHHRAGLVQDREHAHAQLRAVRQERDQHEAERVLAERHAAQHVEEQPGEPRVAEPGDARAGQDPVDHREQREVGPHRRPASSGSGTIASTRPAATLNQ